MIVKLDQRDILMCGSRERLYELINRKIAPLIVLWIANSWVDCEDQATTFRVVTSACVVIPAPEPVVAKKEGRRIVSVEDLGK